MFCVLPKITKTRFCGWKCNFNQFALKISAGGVSCVLPLPRDGRPCSWIDHKPAARLMGLKHPFNLLKILTAILFIAAGWNNFKPQQPGTIKCTNNSLESVFLKIKILLNMCSLPHLYLQEQYENKIHTK